MKTSRWVSISLLALFSVMNVWAGPKWVVTDQELTVWDSPQYFNKLGMVHRGYEIEEVALEDDMIRFVYEGKTAYVATYCCKRVDESAQHAGEDTVALGQAATTSVAAKSAGKDAGEKGRGASADSDAGDAAAAVRGPVQAGSFPAWAVCLLGILCIPVFAFGIVSFVFTVFYIFKYDKLREWFEKKCECSCIPAKRLNKMLVAPLLAAVAMLAINGISMLCLSGMPQSGGIGPAELGCICAVVVAVVAVPVLILRHKYLQYKELYGAKAARWITVYSLLSLVAVYIICMVAVYVVLAVLALMALCFLAKESQSGGALSTENGGTKNSSGASCNTCIHFGNNFCTKYSNPVYPGQCCGSHIWK